MYDSQDAYNQHIERIAELAADLDDENDRQELLFEETDHTVWQMDADDALSALRYSHVEPNEWKHLVGEDSHYTEVLQAMIFDAMRQDIYEELHKLDTEQ